MNVKLCDPKFHGAKCAIESSTFEAADTRAISNSAILHFLFVLRSHESSPGYEEGTV